MKRILLVVGLLLTLFLLTLIALPFVIDINDFKPLIEQKISQNLKTKISIGSLELSTLGGIGITMKGLNATNPPDFSETAFLSAESGLIRLKLTPLLTGKLFLELRLKNPRFFMERTLEGEWNFLSLVKKEAVLSEKQTAPSSKIKRSQAFVAYVIKNSKVSIAIDDGSLTLSDQKTNKKTTISHLIVNLQDLAFGHPFTLNMAGYVIPTVWDKFHIDGDFSLLGQLTLYQEKLILKQGKLLWKDLNISFSGEGRIKEPFSFSAQAQIAPLQLSHFRDNAPLLATYPLEGILSVPRLELNHAGGDLKNLKWTAQFDLKEGGMELASWSKSLKKYKVEASHTAQFEGSAELSSEGGTMAHWKTTLSLDLSQANINSVFFKKKPPTPLQLRLEASGDSQIAKISTLRLKIHNLIMETKGEITELSTAPSLNLEFAIPEFPLTDWETILPNLPKILTRGKVSAQGGIQGRPREPRTLSLLLKKGDLKLHTLNASLTGSLSDLEEKNIDILVEAPKFSLTGWSQYFPKGSSLSQDGTTGEVQFRFQAQGKLKEFDKLKINGETQLSSLKFNISEEFAKKLPISGIINMDGSATYKLTGRVPEAGDISLKGDLTDTVINIKDLFKKPSKVKLLMEAHMKLRPNELSIERSLVTLGSSTVTGSGKILRLSGNPIASIDIDIKSLMLEEMSKFSMKLAPLDPSGKVEGRVSTRAALSPFSFSSLGGNFTLRGGGAKIPKLKYPLSNTEARVSLHQRLWNIDEIALNYGKTRVEGSALFNPGKVSRARFDLHVNDIAIDDFIPDTAGNASEPSSPEITAEKKKRELLQFLKNPLFKSLDLEGKLQIGKLRYRKFVFSNFRLTTELHDKVWKIDPVIFDMAEGKVRLWSTASLRDGDTTYSLQLATNNVDVEKFLREQQSPAADKFTGLFSSRLRLQSQGILTSDFLDNLEGEGKIQFENGRFSLFNLTEKILGGLRASGPLRLFVPNVKVEDDYELIQSSLIIEKRKLTTPDFVLKGSAMALQGEGWIGFDKTLNYKGMYYLKIKKDSQLAIPFQVTGTLDKPQPLPDMEGIVRGFFTDLTRELFKPPSEKQQAPGKELLEEIFKLQ